jgi:hypothetical protein
MLAQVFRHAVINFRLEGLVLSQSLEEFLTYLKDYTSHIFKLWEEHYCEQLYKETSDIVCETWSLLGTSEVPLDRASSL